MMTVTDLMRFPARRSVFWTLTLLLIGSGVAYAADPGKGSGVYSMHCASCHGPSGAPVMPGVPDFSRGERMMQSDLSLLAVIRKGKGAMPAYQGMLSDDDILNVIAYLRTLR